MKELKRATKWVAGARKVWGTRKKSLVMKSQKKWLGWEVRWNLGSLYRSG